MSDASTSGRTRPVVAGLTDVGRQRKHNEDNVLVDGDLRLFVVADGMGGHNAGDVASKLATESLNRFFTATQGVEIAIELPEEYGDLDAAAKRLVAGIRKANHDVFVVSSGGNQHQGMGSTIVAAHLGEDGVMHIAHVGDSRCYRIRDGELKQLTRDHSLINDALELKPDLTPQELARLPKNIITRALGMKDAVKVDISSDPTRLGDVYLLCSDGLTGMVSNQHILEIVGLTDDPEEACELLVNEANYGGGTDNISAVVIRIDAEEAEETVDEAPHETAVDGVQVGEVEVAYFGDAVPSDAPRRVTLPVGNGEDVEVPEITGRWSNPPPAIPHCTSCGYELFSGNFFCVECGARIEEPF